MSKDPESVILILTSVRGLVTSCLSSCPPSPQPDKWAHGGVDSTVPGSSLTGCRLCRSHPRANRTRTEQSIQMRQGRSWFRRCRLKGQIRGPGWQRSPESTAHFTMQPFCRVELEERRFWSVSARVQPTWRLTENHPDFTFPSLLLASVPGMTSSMHERAPRTPRSRQKPPSVTPVKSESYLFTRTESTLT